MKIAHLLAATALVCAPASAQQFITGQWTLAPGPNNLEDNYPAWGWCYSLAWVMDQPGGEGYMRSG